MNYPFKFYASAAALYDALAEDAFYIAMEDSVPGFADQGRDAMLRYYDYSMQEAAQSGILHVADDPAMGASVWARPLSAAQSAERERDKKRFLLAWMGAASLERYLRITASMANLSGPAIPEGSWYLSILGVAPAMQCRGVGVDLVQPILASADREAHPVFLETFTPRNISFYRRMGFDVRLAVDEPVTENRYWVMVRDPVCIAER